MRSWESLATTILVVAAMAMAAVVFKREFLSPAPSATTLTGSANYVSARCVEEWEELLQAGRLIGSPTAAVKVVEFTDFECPYCRQFHHAFLQAQERYGEDLSLSIVHFPLRGHPFAEPAARASECAARQERFGAFVDVVFAKQDSLGLKRWTSYAAEASVPDTAGFAVCIASEESLPQVERGRELGTMVGVNATPTIIVNGWLIRLTSPSALSGVVAEALDGDGLFATRTH